jgi:Tfp pilus assembly protein PilO
MAEGNFYSQLAKKSPAYKAGLLALMMGMLGLFYWQFWYSALRDERDDLETRRQVAIQKQAKLDTELAAHKQLSDENERLQKRIANNQRALPTEAELPAFFKHLQRKATDAGVSIQRWDYQKEKPIDVYIRVPVDIELVGTFYGVMKYFALLEPKRDVVSDAPAAPSAPATGGAGGAVDSSAAGAVDSSAAGGSSPAATDDDEQIGERIVSIENLTLGKAKVVDGEIQLTATFTASTFRQQEAETKDDKKDGKKAQDKNAKGAAKAKTGAKK